MPGLVELEYKSLAPGGLTKVPTDADFARFLRAVFGESVKIADKFGSGDLTIDEWYKRFSLLVAEAHTGAHALGRARAGVPGAVNEHDALVGRARLDADSDWLLNFRDDLENGRYGEPGTDDFKIKGVKQRQKLYALKARGTAGEAFVQNSEDDDEFDWVLGGAEKHCSDCPIFASRGPYTKDNLPTTPGACDTPCLGNCLCFVRRRRDKLHGFKPVKA